MAETTDDSETSLVPFPRAPDTLLPSALNTNVSALDETLNNNIKQGTSGSLSTNAGGAKTTFQAGGSLLDWHVLAIASLASKLTYGEFGKTIGLNNVVENIYCLPTVGHGASFTVKAHDPNKFSLKDKRRLEDLGVSGIVVKRLRHQSSSTSNDANRLAAILFELRVLTHKPLHEHPNIVTFVGLIWEGDPLGRDLLWPILIMERAEHGSLAQFQQRRLTLRYQTKRDLCSDIAAGLDALHAYGVVHGDVKNENILIFEHRERGFIAKLADFGCAVLDQDELDQRTAGLGGTPPWNAPEFRDSKLARAWMKATDVYSYGFVVWRVMIDGRDPFESFKFGDTGKLATIEAWKLQDELIEKAIWSLVSQPESDMQVEEICAIFEATLQKAPSRRDLKLVLEIFDREAKFHSAVTDGPSTRSLEKIESEMEQTFLATFMLKDFDHLFQRQYIRALQYSLRLYQNNAEFSERAKCALLRCFMTGIGGDPSIDSALEVLMDICTKDNEVVLRQAGMILLSVRLFEAYGKPIPDHFPVNDWLWCNAIFGSRHAHNVLLARDPKLAASAFEISRTKIFGVNHEVQETIKQLLKQPTFLTDALGRGGNSSDSFVFPATENGDTPLHCAAMANEVEAVQALVEKTRADVNALNFLRESPLLQACRAGHFEVACFLLSHGADPTIQSIAHGESCLHFLSWFQEEWQMRYITKECLERGADLEAFAAGPQGGMFSYESAESGSPLHWAVGNANIAAVMALCDAGADIFKEYANAEGLFRHPVNVAASRVYVDILRYFLHDCGVLKLARSCTATYSKVDSLLHSLVFGTMNDPVSNKILHGAMYAESFAEAVSLLKEANVSFDRVDAGTFLFGVARTGDVRRLETLLKSGCPVDALTGETTLLGRCIAACDKSMFDLALAYGANVMRQTSDGYGYLDLCVIHHHRNTYFAEELLKRGAFVDGIPSADSTPFRNAVKRGCFELATLFLRYGADKEALKSGITVLGDLTMAGPDYPVVCLQFLLEPPHEFGASSFIVAPHLQITALQFAATKDEAGRDGDGNMPHLAYILERFPLPKHLNAAATGMTALHLSVQSCFPESAELLLEAGADPNLLNCEHRTALDMAVEMAENADPDHPDFPREVYEAGDKSTAMYIARRWRLIEILVSFGAVLSEDLPTAGFGAAQLVKAELQPLLEDRGYMCYSDSLPTLEEWTDCLRPVINNHLKDIVVRSPSLDRSLDEFTEAICEALRPYYLKISIERDTGGVSLVFQGMGAREAEEVEISLVQASS